MSKYIVFSGFLGAGKTTTMLALAGYLKSVGSKAALLVNDLGARDLVDGEFTAKRGYSSEVITGDCICYQTERLIDKLRRLRDGEKAELILSDVPGCGIGALDHVYHKLEALCPDEFELCPFTAVADPERLRMIMPEQADIALPLEMRYLFDAQLREAELILLNKIDLLSDAQRRVCMDFLAEHYGHAKVIAISAKNGEGIPDAAAYIMSARSALPAVDIGYGGEEFCAAEKKLSWYDRSLYAKRPDGSDVDGNAFVANVIEAIRRELQAAERNAPHLKVFAGGDDGSFAKASLIGVDHGVEFDVRFAQPQSGLRIIINARAACESEKLDELADRALRKTAKAQGLKLHVFFTECFGMMDEGR